MRGLRWVIGGAALLLAPGCPTVDPYACNDASQCELGGAAGSCEAGRCAYPDDTCASGLRYPEQTDGERGGMCTPANAETEAPPGTTSTTTSPSTTLPTVPTTAESSTSEDEGSTSSSTGAAGCELEPSEPLAFSGETDLVVEQLHITADGTRALRVSDSPGAHIRDLRIDFAGNAGIVVENSANAVVERVHLTNVGAPESGAADPSEIGIHVENSPGIRIANVRIDDARSGIQVLDSEDAVLEDFVGHNARGEVGSPDDSGGDCALVQSCADAIVRRFGCTNDPEGVTAHAGVFIDRSPRALVDDGLANNVSRDAGTGVRVHTFDGTGGVTVQNVDVVGGRDSCFDGYMGDDLTFIDTRCRNNAGHAWTVANVVGDVWVQGGRYYNLGQGPGCCGDPFAEFDVAEDQFVPRLAPDVAAPCSAG